MSEREVKANAYSKGSGGLSPPHRARVINSFSDISSFLDIERMSSTCAVYRFFYAKYFLDTVVFYQATECSRYPYHLDKHQNRERRADWNQSSLSRYTQQTIYWWIRWKSNAEDFKNSCRSTSRESSLRIDWSVYYSMLIAESTE